MLSAAAVHARQEPRRTRAPLVAHLVAAVVLTGALAACSGSGSPAGRATGLPGRPAPAPGRSAAAAPSAALPSPVSLQQSWRKYADCVAEHGGGRLAIVTGASPPQRPVSPAKARRAASACQGLLESALGGAATVSAGQAALNSFSRCMRNHGVQVQPDLQAVRFLELQDPKVSGAMSQCRALLPRPGATVLPR